MAKSRYFNTPLFGNPQEPVHYATYDLPDRVKGIPAPDLLGTVTTMQYVWQHGDRLDKLSSKFFGDDEYGWLLAAVNNIVDPLGIKEGTSLTIPTDIVPILQKLNLM